MSILQTFLEVSKASFALTAVLQLAVTSIVGFVAVKAVSRQSAPLRSLVTISVIILLVLTLIVSAVFRLSNVSWFKAVPLPIESAETVVMSEIVTPNESTPVEISSTPTHIITTSPAVQRFTISREQIFTLLGIIWLSGSFFMILKLFYGLVFMRGFKYGLTPVKDAHFDIMLIAIAEKFGKSKTPLLYTSAKVETPVTTGISNPIVIIPENLLGKLSNSEMKSILLHELAHIYSCDHLMGVFKRIVIAANWWNPLVYIISAEHSAAREEIADNHVLLELRPKTYSECLAGLAEKVCLINNLPATAGMAGKTSGLEQRIKNILSKKRKLTMQIGKNVKGMVYALICFSAVFIAGVQYTFADNPNEKKEMDLNTYHKLNFKGRKLSPEEAKKLEIKVSKNPGDLETVAELLGYYSNKQYKDKVIKQKREKIILQLIKDYPESRILECTLLNRQDDYKTAVKLWKYQVAKHPDNLKILWNASRNIFVIDRELAEKYLQKGQSLEPENPRWSTWLGALYSSPGSKKTQLAFQQYKKAYDETKTKNSNAILPYLAKSAIKTGKFQDAEKYAHQMLVQAKEIGKKNKNYGDLIYYGNFILGMLKLKKGNIDDACKYLLEAGKTPGSPVLNSFGPDLTLAQNLLEKGKKECVMKFLKSCSRFWKESRCDIWIKQIESGNAPDWVIINGQLLPTAKSAIKNEPQVFIYKVNNCKASELANMLQAGYPEVKIFADEVHNRLVIRTTPETYSLVKHLLVRYDVSQDQILLQMLILEVTVTGNNVNNDSVFNLLKDCFPESPGKDYSMMTERAQGNLTSYRISCYDKSPFALIKALSQKTKIKIISSPQVLAHNNTKTKISVGMRLLASEGSNSKVISDGIATEVIPHIKKGQQIEIDFKQIYKSADKIIDTNIGGVLMKNGQSVIIGSIKRNDSSSNFGKSVSRVVIFITGHIINKDTNLQKLLAGFKERRETLKHL